MCLENGLRLDAVSHKVLVGPLRGLDVEAKILEFPCYPEYTSLVLIVYSDQDCPLIGKDLLCRFLRLVEGKSERIGKTQDLPCRPHLRSKHRVHLMEHIEGKHRFLHAKVSERRFFEIQVSKFLSQHDLSGDASHGNSADFGYEGYGSGCPRIRFQDVDHVVSNGILYIHKTYHIELHGYLPRVVANGIYVTDRNAYRRDHAGRIAGVYTGEFDVFHYGGNKGIGSIRDCIRLRLDGV